VLPHGEKRRCDLHLISWLDRQGVFVPDFNWTRPSHRFMVAA
jgi:hypothetical protein